MIHGMGYRLSCVALAEVAEHADYSDARAVLARLFAAGDQIAIAPQVLTEFIHVVTDPRRFTNPLDMLTARQVAEQWWTASDVVQVLANDGAMRQFLGWLAQYFLGRKRVLDTIACRDLSTNWSPIAAHNQPDRFRSFRGVFVHHTEGRGDKSLNAGHSLPFASARAGDMEEHEN